MEGLAETIENVGLAQEIQKGLAPSLQKKPDFNALADKIEAKKASIGGGSAMDCFGSELGKYCITTWANSSGIDLSQARRKSSLGPGTEVQKSPPTAAGVEANWEGFKASPAFEVLCKYAALGEAIKSETPHAKQFEEVRALGRGAFGAVWLAFKKDTGAPLATKKMVKTIAKQNKMLKDVLIEREVLAKIRSPFCVNLHYSFQDADNIALVLSLMPGGDLAFLLQTRYSDAKKKEDRKFTPLSAQTLKFYAASMACGLQAIHAAGYVYRDLKPQNVLLDAEGQVRISDMGLTADITKGPIKQCSGTRGYWSPETIKKEKYTTAPDWWSLGVTVYVLNSDKMPFKGKTDEEKDAATCSGEIEYNHGESDEIKAFVSALCTIDPEARLGCKGGLADIKGAPFFAGFDWAALEGGTMDAEVKPNVNDINAPSKSEIDGFKKPKDVQWTDEDQAAFKEWDYMDVELWYKYEAPFRIKSKKEIDKSGGGGGGCCTIA